MPNSMILQQVERIMEPFFTNDASGYVRLIFAFMLGMSPIFGLVVWFLRRGPDSRIARIELDLNNLGRKVDEMEEGWAREQEARVQLHREIANNQRELVEMLASNSNAIQAHIHAVAVDVARLQERSDISQGFERLGSAIERVIPKPRG